MLPLFSQFRVPPIILMVLIGFGINASLFANPTGGDVVGGSAQISGGAGTLVVTQSTDRAIINWQDFSIGAGELTKFIQPSATSAVLNRVVGANISAIYGTLEATGRVYLINPNGIVIGPSGVIKTQEFIASTHNISNANFLAGGDLHFTGSSSAKVSNAGTISALGGDIILLAREVENTGSLNAPNGTVALAAGSELLLKEAGTERVFVKAGTGSVVNRGLITAAQAELKANGDNLYALAINNEGAIRATGFQNVGGRVLLKASTGTVHNSGNITATRQRATGETDGGTIQISGQRVFLTGNGLLSVDGVHGGTIEIGGSYRGQNSELVNSTYTYVGSGARLTADGSAQGGQVVVWSNESTIFNGAISALGAGTVEVSGKNGLVFNGTVVTGGGSLLLDPSTITVQASSPNIDGLGLGNNIVTAADLQNAATYPGVNSVITAAALNALLTGNATVTLSATIQITINATITASGVGSLLLQAPVVNLNQAIALNGGVLSGTATVVNVGASGRIQNGIDAVGVGGTVNLAAATYIEEIHIAKNLTLNGAGASTVIQIPTGTPLTNAYVFTTNGVTYHPIVKVENASAVNIQNLTVDGLGVSTNFLNYPFVGIGYHNAGGVINNVTVTNINEGPTAGTQHGFGIHAVVDTGSYTFQVLNSKINKFEKQGITLRGAGLTYTVSNNLIDNLNHIWATPNGIVVQNGATGTINNNTLTNIRGFLAGTDAAGILLINAGANSQVLNNNLTNIDLGIYSASALGDILIQANNFTTGNYGVYVSSTGGVSTIKDNVVSNAAIVAGYIYSATDQIFHLINNSWQNSPDGLYIQGGGTTGPLVSMTNDRFNNISGYYISLYTAPHDVYSQPGSAHITFDGLDSGTYAGASSPLTLAQFTAINAKIYDQRDTPEGLVLPYFTIFASPVTAPIINSSNPLLQPLGGQADLLTGDITGFRPHQEGSYYIAFRTSTAGNQAAWGDLPILDALSSYDVSGLNKDTIRILPRTEGGVSDGLTFLNPSL